MMEGRYRLHDMIPAVRLTARRSSEGGSIFMIPSGSLLYIQGASPLTNMIRARWRNDFYAVFEEDVVERSEEMTGFGIEAGEEILEEAETD
jgi:hypothetical protein